MDDDQGRYAPEFTDRPRWRPPYPPSPTDPVGLTD